MGNGQARKEGCIFKYLSRRLESEVACSCVRIVQSSYGAYFPFIHITDAAIFASAKIRN